MRPSLSVISFGPSALRRRASLVRTLCKATAAKDAAAEPPSHPVASVAEPEPAASAVSSLNAAEFKEFQAWRAMQQNDELKEFQAWRDVQQIKGHEPVHPSLDKIVATGVVAAAATPLVLLLPTWAPLVFVESAFAYFDGAVDAWPFWTLRASIALAGHPAITLTCATSCALAFASQRSVLNSVGWLPNSTALIDEATRVGRRVGFASALVSPIAVLSVHQVLTMGWLDGLMPRALALDYWGQGGGFATFSYLFVLYLASMPVTTWCAATISPTCAPFLYANDGGASLRTLMQYAGGALALVTIMSFYMHRQWEFTMLRQTEIPGAGRVDQETGERVYKVVDDPTDEKGGESEPWQNELHRHWEYDVAGLSSVPGVGPAAAKHMDGLIQSARSASIQTTMHTEELRRARVAQECEFGPLKQSQKAGKGGSRSLGRLRADESAKFDGHKRQLRRNLEVAMRRASDRERSRELERATASLEALREPEAGLSRKQLKVVNGALLAVAEARGLCETFALNEEKVMMRRVARRHDHGRKGCEEYRV